MRPRLPVADDARYAPAARLLAEPARERMLWALSDGRELSAGELAQVAGVKPATASGHLRRLTKGGLVRVESRGRSRFFRLAGRDVARAMEVLALLAPAGKSSGEPPAAIPSIRFARTCYDHLAGSVGVRLTESLLAAGHLTRSSNGFRVTEGGSEALAEFGVDVGHVQIRAMHTGRAFARACLDWSERRYHLAGALGAALVERLIQLDWIERLPATRAVRVSSAGRRGFKRVFDLRIL
jgi:DNA-binding transcriptional ArsR family regulator